MKKYIYIILITVISLGFNACSDDDEKSPGNPVINAKTEFGSAIFGDSLPFTINVADSEVPLSTLKVRLFYSDDMVSETVIRTKTDGDYTGKIFIPYYANIPNGTATLKLVLQNIHLTITETEYNLPLTRPDFPYLTFISGEKEYRMERTDLYEYAVTEDFPVKIKGYIKAPVVGDNGNEITFGWEDNQITQGSESPIPFSYSHADKYSITFNTFNYEAAPFIVSYSINEETMARVDDINYKVEMDFAKDEEITVTGIDDFSDWWIDQDYLKKDGDKLTFNAPDGKYRITANFSHKYLIVEVMSGNDLASLQADGTGTIWVIGNNVGKPSLANTTGWDTNKGLCMVPIGDKKYRITLIGGTNISLETIDFKFFHQKGWGGEFEHTTISTTSDIVYIGDGTNDKGKGNLGLVAGKTLTKDKAYIFTVDVSAGNNKAVLTVEEK